MNNVLLLTLDDMNYNSKDFLKNGREPLTPNMDAIQADATLFTDSHVTIAVCQPSRSVLMTGRYPHHNGARGFERIDDNIPTLSGILHKNGFFTGIIGKEDHLAPKEAFCWDVYERTMNREGRFGRSPQVYYEKTRDFLNASRKSGKPFFLMDNSHDPHRPFAGSDDELKEFGENIPVSFRYSANDVIVPDFLPDLPDVRTEIAQYLTSVHRADETVGEILRALKESGEYENTIIMILSDNGMALPFCKANCYLNSTKSTYIFRWPGHTSRHECSALVSGIDYMPTILDILGLESPGKMDGTSMVHLFESDDEQYDDLFTFFYKTARNPVTKAERHFPMRCVVDRHYSYIYNAWSDGETKYIAESMAGLTYKAMEEATKTDPKIADRVAMYRLRVKEELYDIEKDPGALDNLIGKDEFTSVADHYRKRMKHYMESSQDELLPAFLKDVPASV